MEAMMLSRSQRPRTRARKGAAAVVIFVVIVAQITASPSAKAQTLATLYSFCAQGGNCLDGYYPVAGLVLGSDGNFYGTTSMGGPNPANCPLCDGQGGGTIFKITPGGTITTLYTFCAQPVCADGQFPSAALIQGSDGNFYGTTPAGGSYGSGCFSDLGCGTVFKITPSGALTTLHTFCTAANCEDGGGPQAPLIQANDGNFYGTTAGGGDNGQGTIFKMTPDGALTTLYSFCQGSGCTSGQEPTAGLLQGSDGSFYGTTQLSSNDSGTIFKFTPGGGLTTLYTFCTQSGCTDGKMPMAGLVQGSDGNFYGTTYCGGTSTALLPACEGVGAGTVFKITPAGVLTTLYRFCGQSDCTDGEYPMAGLVQGSDGNFYGTTEWGGVYGGGPAGDTGGTIFQTAPTGPLSTLYSFCAQTNCTDGRYPMAGLVQATDGNFYGTTWMGGAAGAGTVFRVSLVSGLPAAFLSPPRLGFGGQVEGTTSAPQSVTVTNTGTANLIFPAGAVTLSGTGASSFMIASDGCSGQTVPPNGTCPVSVTFNPPTLPSAAKAPRSVSPTTPQTALKPRA
jgi:uncharacterized repeat protein (TIGR03803 family)